MKPSKRIAELFRQNQYKYHSIAECMIECVCMFLDEQAESDIEPKITIREDYQEPTEVQETIHQETLKKAKIASERIDKGRTLEEVLAVIPKTIDYKDSTYILGNLDMRDAIIAAIKKLYNS